MNKSKKGVAILDIVSNNDKMESLRKKFSDRKIVFHTIDVTDILSVEQTFREILSELKRIDILVNSAGIVDEKKADLCVKVNLVRF